MKRSMVFGRVVSVVMSLLMLVGMMSAVSVWAEEKTTKDGFVYEITGNEVTITGYIGEAVDLVIPQKIDKKPVTSIGEYAFDFCFSLKSITIPDGVESIGEEAFSYCSSLESITISESVTSIGEDAFWWCSSIAEIKVDADNKVYDSRDNCKAIIETATNTLILGCKNTAIPVGVTSIGDSAFYGCDFLESVLIPESVESIGDRAFDWCESLESIIIPDGVKNIGDASFGACESLASITIPESVESIGVSPFYWCTSLTEIKVDKNNAVYDSRENCNAIIETATNTLVAGCDNTDIPDSVENIGEYAFEGCKSLESIIIPDSVERIEKGTFYGCISLESVVIPERVESIEYMAFAYCRSLESVVIPENVTSIGEYAFADCAVLKDIYYVGTQQQWEESFSNLKGDSSYDEPLEVTMHYNYGADEEAEANGEAQADEDKEDTRSASAVRRDKDDEDEDSNLVLIIALCIGGGLILGAGLVLVTVAVMKKKTSTSPKDSVPQNNIPPATYAQQSVAENTSPSEQTVAEPEINENTQQDE